MNEKPAPTEGQSSEQAASLATSDDAACSLVKVRLKFRAVEYHAIVREVPSEKIEAFRNDGELFDWLHSEFVDDGMSDSKIETDEFLLDHFETLPDPENDSDLPPTPPAPQDHAH